ncbi:BnaC09g18840D [Brassica napus]|uniref:BnaC09g18840D protein n=1 Tax=Brassica napus TaxID=3708 RepID=A0A078G9M4_BRANA|nr:BnaC09g18840D [Brassica napus]
MDLPELPPRMFTLGEDPAAIRSISYHSDDTKLFKALCDCLTADEYDDLKASKLGVFIKFKELKFGWTSRLFEHLTGLNCDYIKDLENPRCEVTKEMAAFWEKLRVDLDTGPRYIEGKKFSSATPASLVRLVMDLENFENYPWRRVAFKVLMDSLKAKDLTQTGYTVDGFIQVLQVWAYYAMPELGANYGSPVPNRPSLLLLAYKGGKGQHKCFKATIKKQNNMNNFVRKDFDEMFPKWDRDVDDPAADNIIKVMFNDPGWKWTIDCWQVTMKTEKTTMKSESVVKEESSRPRKKARKGSSVSAETPAAGSDGFGMTKQHIERAFKDISDANSYGFGTCLREIKLLGDRMVAVEKKVGITKKGGSSDDRQLTTTSNPPKPVHEPGSKSVNEAKSGQKEAKEPSLTTEPSSSRELCLVRPADDLPSDDPSVLLLDKQVSTASDLLLEEARRQTKKETAMVNLREKNERERKLASTQQTPFKGNNTAKQIIPNKKVGRGYDPFAPYDKKKSKELTEWVQQDLSYKLPLKKKPRSCPSRFYHVLRTPLEWLTDHWRASYPDFKSDNGDANGLGRRLPGGAWNYHAGEIPSFCKSKKWSLVTMVPYLLVECALSDEQKVQYTLESYTYARQTDGVPQCRAGDCGPFALKYIECHALGMKFPKTFNKRNGKSIREKMAVDIFQELPMCHEWENQDNDENLGTLGDINRVRIG